MIKVGVVGASGYTGAELLRILYRHPQVEVTCITSRQYAGKSIGEVFPSLRTCYDLVCEDLSPLEIADRADLVFTAVPHQTAMDIVPQLLDAGVKVVDLSADYRLWDASVYEAWYQGHTDSQRLGRVPYGLPEIYRKNIVSAPLVANPGCYPTSVILGLAPMIKAALVDYGSLVIDSKSGTSGAGRSAKVGSLFCEVNEGFKAYGVGSHRHTPEIEQILGHLASEQVIVNFTPHLLPVNRGILSTIYFKLTRTMSTPELHGILQAFYAEEAFVRVLPPGEVPNVAFVSGSNYCDIGVVSDPRTGRAIIVSAIDNLVKGASGQAVQNMNLMLGLSETQGLLDPAPFP